MFLHLCVILFTGVGFAWQYEMCMVGNGACMAGDMHGRGVCVDRGACMAGVCMVGACVALGGMCGRAACKLVAWQCVVGGHVIWAGGLMCGRGVLTEQERCMCGFRACMSRGCGCMAGEVSAMTGAWQPVWQGGVCGRGACVAGGLHGRGHACHACRTHFFKYYEGVQYGQCADV